MKKLAVLISFLASLGTLATVAYWVGKVITAVVIGLAISREKS